MKLFLSLLVSAAVVSPAFAGITANGSYDDDMMIVDTYEAPEAKFFEYEEYADVPMGDAIKDITIHFTSSFSQDWCVWIVVSVPDFTVMDGGINGTICDGGADDNWRIDSVEPLGGGTYEIHGTHVGDGSCVDTICMIGTKNGRAVEGTNYGWNGPCDSWPMEGGLINGCDF